MSRIRRTGYAGGDLTLRGVRRDRALLADSLEVASIPMSEASEAFEVDILDGSSVLRVLESGTPSATYTAAQQVADWGRRLRRVEPCESASASSPPSSAAPCR